MRQEKSVPHLWINVKRGSVGVPKQSKSRNLHERLIVCIDDVLHFMEDADVPFTKDAKVLLQKTKKLTERSRDSYYFMGQFKIDQEFTSKSTCLYLIEADFLSRQWGPLQGSASSIQGEGWSFYSIMGHLYWYQQAAQSRDDNAQAKYRSCRPRRREHFLKESGRDLKAKAEPFITETGYSTMQRSSLGTA
jgi:hypothetical protein